MNKLFLALTLCGVMILTGCTATWVTTLDGILAAAAPALVNILQIVALEQGKPVDGALVTKINTDAAAVKALAADFASASTAAGPAVCTQLQAALTTYEADLPAVMEVAQVVDANTQLKITTLSGLIVGVFNSIEPLIPACKAPVTLKAVHTVPLPVKNFIADYNAVLVKPVGIPVIDKATPKLKLHDHSKAVRKLTLGLVK